MFALPLVNVHRLKSWLTRLIKLKVCVSIKAIFKNLTFLLHDVWRPL